MQIKKKIWPEYFNDVRDGTKKFEIRLADFDVKEGDTLLLEEWNPRTKQYTGRKIEKKIASVYEISPEKFYSPEQVRNHGLYVIEIK